LFFSAPSQRKKFEVVALYWDTVGRIDKAQDFEGSSTSIGEFMNANPKNANFPKTMGWTILLILFGVAAICGGTKWLTVLVPAALLVWYGSGAAVWSSRN
jgi:hypothetical protein